MMLLSVLTGVCLVAAVAAIAALIKAGALSRQLDEFKKSDQNTTAMLQAFGELISRNQRDSAENMDRRLADINTRFSQMALENNRQLEEMRRTVDEKLQKTLDERITQSFKLVNDRLEQVYKGLGEMQNLAVGVGDLKKVLSNVKTRGILGEVQLGAILEQILAPEQYAENVVTKSTGADRVEFAVKLPGDDERTVWLPIDAKFPADSYSRLVDAYELGDPAAIEEAAKNLERVIKSEARDIRTKYIEPPYTTDFGIMFLPFEGLYAEVVRRGLLEVLQREYKVNIAGPTTMAALLNSLQMGFKTLAIQKHSGEVWEVLGAVKTEFANFSKVLGNARNRIRMADEELEKLIGTRTRAIERKLRGVESLTAAESVDVLDLPDLSDI
ncbi:MAG: DNA recombination protein RmuC [Firmicutes bacterium]|nr:DNA recombination protein RmuC [Bacillota bacterium]